MNIDSVRKEFRRLARATIHDRIDTDVWLGYGDVLTFSVRDHSRNRFVEVASRDFEESMVLAPIVDTLRRMMET
jgi:hypothetical protein